MNLAALKELQRPLPPRQGSWGEEHRVLAMVVWRRLQTKDPVPVAVVRLAQQAWVPSDPECETYARTLRKHYGRRYRVEIVT